VLARGMQAFVSEMGACLSSRSRKGACAGAFVPAKAKESVPRTKQWAHGIPGQPGPLLGNERWCRKGGSEQRLLLVDVMDDGDQMLAETERTPKKIRAVAASSKGDQASEVHRVWPLVLAPPRVLSGARHREAPERTPSRRHTNGGDAPHSPPTSRGAAGPPSRRAARANRRLA
jgi:hypothetical protein